MYVYECMRERESVCVYIYTYTHTYIRTHTHTYIYAHRVSPMNKYTTTIFYYEKMNFLQNPRYQHFVINSEKLYNQNRHYKVSFVPKIYCIETLTKNKTETPQ